VEQLFEAAQGTGSLLFGAIGTVYLGLIVVVAITAVFASKSGRRKAALEVLRVLLIRRGTSSREELDDSGSRAVSGSGDAHHPPERGD
jgi:hypothetical protein